MAVLQNGKEIQNEADAPRSQTPCWELESPLNEYRLVQAWKDVVGPAIAGYTSNLYIKNQILYVHLTSSVLRQELMMGRDLLVRNLNKQVGAQVIVNIIFR